MKSLLSTPATATQLMEITSFALDNFAYNEAFAQQMRIESEITSMLDEISDTFTSEIVEIVPPTKDRSTSRMNHHNRSKDTRHKANRLYRDNHEYDRGIYHKPWSKGKSKFEGTAKTRSQLVAHRDKLDDFFAGAMYNTEAEINFMLKEMESDFLDWKNRCTFDYPTGNATVWVF